MVAVEISSYSVSDNFTTEVAHFTGLRICELLVMDNNKTLSVNKSLFILW
ncbi:MAG: hypothetical protein TRG1_1961 [Flavobacteriaceae bacterium FS1-H7996/R]|nr:MAG: hypothetical protein TRG1_1961 [Flavobacteriaceae bacterium FS1-H7996/R]